MPRAPAPVPMDFLDALAERRIGEAIERGDLADLPGEGGPLALDDDVLVAPELRAAYRILRNAGFVPPEVTCLREIGELERLLDAAADPAVRTRAARRLEFLWQRLDTRTPQARSRMRAYRNELLARMSGRHEP